MKKEDFKKWINDDLSDNELGNFEKEVMNNLLEHRLQQQFKERLQARRMRRVYIKWGLWILAVLLILGGILYVLNNKNDTHLGFQKTDENHQNSTNIATNSNNLSNQTTIEKGNEGIKNTALNTPPNDARVLPTLESKLKEIPVEKRPLPHAPIDIKTRFSPPSDTEYIYLKSSSDPINYQRYASNGDVEKPISNITFLNLSKKKLKEIPTSVFEHEKLRNLQLNNNQISELPTAIGQLKELENLNLKNNKLTNLPKELTTLKSLRILNLQNNQLKELPSQMDELTELREFILNDNKLSELPFEIGKFTQLTNLDLGNNNLKVLSDGIEHLSKLKSLNLRNNRLAELPTTITQLTNLKYLDLGRNKLKGIPDELFEMKNLDFLNLSGNDIPMADIARLGEELPNCRIIFF